MRTGTVRGAHRAPDRRSGLLAVVALAVLVLVGTVGTLLVGRDGDGPARGAASDPSRAPQDAGSGTPGVAGDVAGWVEAELPSGTTLGAPEELRTALVDAGVPGPRVVAEDAGGLRVVPGDPPADAAVVARFRGDGGTLSVVDPRPGTPTAEQLARRQRLAAAVLANPSAGATGRAADVLRSADVDARLLSLVAGLVTRLDAGIAEFPRAPGQPAGGTPARRVLIGSAGGEELVAGSQAAERVRVFLAAQQPPFAPDLVELTPDGVLVGFDYSSTPDAEVASAVG